MYSKLTKFCTCCLPAFLQPAPVLSRELIISSDLPLGVGPSSLQEEARQEFAQSSRTHFNNFKNKYSMESLDVPSRSKEDVWRVYQKIGAEKAGENDLPGGEGAFGKVWPARRKNAKFHPGTEGPGGEVAVKVIRKREEGEVKMVMREIELMKVLDHPNIVKFYEVYEDKMNYFLVMELLKGGNMLDRLDKKKELGENEVKGYLWQILIAVNYLHSKKVVHTDIKPENFMFPKKESTTVKMIDFGLAQSMKFQDKLTLVAGTPQYTAPEVLEGSYDSKCDIWSIGILAFTLLTRTLPFDGETDDEVYEKIFDTTPDFTLLIKNGVSQECINLVKLLLIKNPKKRYSAEQALNHKWFNERLTSIRTRGQSTLTKHHFENLKNFKLSSLIQREMAYLMVRMFGDTHEIYEIEDIFFAFDTDFSGTIEIDEIKEIANILSEPLTETEAQDIVNSLYFREKRRVTFMEFEAGLLNNEFFRDSDRLYTLFSYLDTDQSGTLDFNDISLAYRRFGVTLHKDKIETMIKECDFDTDGKIDYEEFRRMMRNEVAPTLYKSEIVDIN